MAQEISSKWTKTYWATKDQKENCLKRLKESLADRKKTINKLTLGNAIDQTDKG